MPAFFDRIVRERPLDTNLQCVASGQDGQTLSLSTLETARQRQGLPTIASDCNPTSKSKASTSSKNM